MPLLYKVDSNISEPCMLQMQHSFWTTSHKDFLEVLPVGPMLPDAVNQGHLQPFTALDGVVVVPDSLVYISLSARLDLHQSAESHP